MVARSDPSSPCSCGRRRGCVLPAPGQIMAVYGISHARRIVICKCQIQVSHVMCPVAGVKCCVLCVTCHLYLTPAATATNPANSLILPLRLVYKDPQKIQNTIHSLTRSPQSTGKWGFLDGTDKQTHTHTHLTRRHCNFVNQLTEWVILVNIHKTA